MSSPPFPPISLPPPPPILIFCSTTQSRGLGHSVSNQASESKPCQFETLYGKAAIFFEIRTQPFLTMTIYIMSLVTGESP